MLPTSGYFRSVSCPFFSSGLCERPHCHFRHVNPDSCPVATQAISQPEVLQTDPVLSSSESSTPVGNKPDLLLLVREAILQVQKEVEADKSEKTVNNETSDVSILLLPRNTSESCDDNKSATNGNCDDNLGVILRPQSRPSNIAQYKPTPISQLKRLQSHSKPCHEYAIASTKSCKSLYVPESKSQLGLSDSTVSYIPNPINKGTKAVVVANDSDDDCDTGSAAFSDSDDESEIIKDQHKAELPHKSGTSSESGFDLVNKILLESVTCDSLISAASARRGSETDEPKPNSSKKISKESKSNAESKSPKNKVNKANIVLLNKRNTKKVPKSVIKAEICSPTSKVIKNLKSGSLLSHVKTSGVKELTKNVNKKSKAEVNGEVLVSVTDKINTVKSLKTNVNRSANPSENKNTVNGDISAKRKPYQSVTVADAKRQKTNDNINVTPKEKEALLSEMPSKDMESDPVSIDMPDSDDDDDDDDESNIDEECLQIFNEYVPDVNSTVASIKKTIDIDKGTIPEEVIPGKKRVARNPNQNAVQRTVPISRYKPSPSQTMYERFLRVQQMVMEGREKAVISESNHLSSKTTSEVTLEVRGKRIAHMPSAKNTPLCNNNRTMTSATSSGNISNNAAQTNVKGHVRVSHVPKESSFVRPIIPAEYGSKVPTNIRQRYLNFIINECMKIYDSERDACDRGLSEEKSAYERSCNRAVYLNVVANSIKKLRDEQPKSGKSPPTASSSAAQQRLVSHQFNLGGKKAANVSYSIERIKHKCNNTDMTGINLYKTLQKYILTEKQLVENGFPLPHPTETGVTVILKPIVKRNTTDSNEKVCRRCGTTFKVTENGVFLTKDECFYHWGRAYKVRSGGGFETRYSCCQAGLHSEGCCVGKLHVHDDIDPLNLKGFVKTLPKSPPADGNYEVFALDCEMCYTNMGNELTRITVVDSNSKPVFESLVKPENPIIDYNTRFSGISEVDLKDVRTTLRDVQAIILNKFSDKTILIGHSLESDFKALKLVHKTVIDTSVVFPHKLGAPYKRALRTLVGEYLKKIIQNNVDGHDSQEDAASCMQLMLWKAKEDLKMVY